MHQGVGCACVRVCVVNTVSWNISRMDGGESSDNHIKNKAFYDDDDDEAYFPGR